MTKYITTATAAAALAFGLSSASAVQIEGTISFGSLAQVTPTPSGSAFPAVTGLDFTPGLNAQVNGSTGDFAGLNDTLVSFHDLNLGAAPDFTSSGILWDLGLPTWLHFDVLSAGNFSANNTFLNIAGTGTVSGFNPVNGQTYDATPGTFTITASRPLGAAGEQQVSFSFASEADTRPTPPVTTPDGGATAMLLGVGILGVGAMARRK